MSPTNPPPYRRSRVHYIHKLMLLGDMSSYRCWTKNRGNTSQHGWWKSWKTPMNKWDDLGGKNPYFWKHPCLHMSSMFQLRYGSTFWRSSEIQRSHHRTNTISWSPGSQHAECLSWNHCHRGQDWRGQGHENHSRVTPEWLCSWCLFPRIGPYLVLGSKFHSVFTFERNFNMIFTLFMKPKKTR